jgi:hypothetical protein
VIGVALVVENESARVGDDGVAGGQEDSEDQVFATILDWVLERLRGQPMAPQPNRPRLRSRS